MEQVASTQEEERMKIARILVSFIRTRARKNSEESKKDLDACNLSKLKNRDDFSAYREQRLDIEAGILALAKIASELEKQGQFSEKYGDTKYQICNLRNTDLRSLQLNGINLSNFDFAGTDFTRAFLPGANFSDTYLFRVDFSSSYLSSAIFDNAYLMDAIFDGSNVSNSRFKSSRYLTQEQIDEVEHNLGEPPILPEELHFPTENP